MIENLFGFICMKLFHIIFEPVKKNDREKHPSLEVGDIGSKIHVSAETHKYEEAFQEIHDATKVTNMTKCFEK